MRAQADREGQCRTLLNAGRLWGWQASHASGTRISHHDWQLASQDWSLLQEPKSAPIWEAMIGLAGDLAGARVLDLGCAGGGLLQLLSARGAYALGIDISTSLVRVASSKENCGVVVGDLQFLPFLAESFDFIFAANSLQFATDPVAALSQCSRALVHEGCLVFAVWAEPESSDQSAIFRILAEVLDRPLEELEVFRLSRRKDLLHRLDTVSGLTLAEVVEMDVIFEYESEPDAVRAQTASGPFQELKAQLGARELRRRLRRALQDFKSRSGKITMRNRFRLVKARKD